jgi:hypothetical protein
MHAYEVTVDVDADVEDAFVRYMTGKHIPEILATGCFVAIRFETSGPGRYRTRYEAAGKADLERYLAGHTEAFRRDFAAHFPAGCRPSRETWQGLRTWEA